MDSFCPLEVLVADDSRTIRTQLKQILTQEGYRVTEACSGREAVDLIQENPPFLAILDINMPELDGYGVCQELKELGKPYTQIPIVLLTSLDSHALELLGGELGAYLRKPIKQAELLETIEAFLPEFSQK
jgi:DNA-binding response OmpR family regulator